jgi:hypothetical protein
MPAFSYYYSIPYLILFSLLLINSIPLLNIWRSNILNYKYTDIFQKISVITILIIFFGFRGYVLIDWLTYSQFYADLPTLFNDLGLLKNIIGSGSLNGRLVERGFLVYMVICKTISSNYLFFQFISASIDLYILFLFFKREIPDCIVLGFVFFILFQGLQFEMHLLRSMKSMLLFILSIKYIKERKFINFLIFNCIGALFHITSIIYIPLYFILNKNIARSIVFTIFIIGNIIYLLQLEWFKLILSHISLPGRMGYLINTYLVSVRYSASHGITIGYIERTFTFFFVYFFSKRITNVDNNNNIYINIIYLYIFIFLYFSEMFIFIERIVNMFIFSYWIIYPKIYSLISEKMKYAFILLLFLYGGVKLTLNCNKAYYYYDNIMLPYRSFQERKEIYMKNIKTIHKGGMQ